MTRYSVSCFSPPASLSIKKGEKVKVTGWMRKNRILAESIENLTQNGPTCQCGSPKAPRRYVFGKISLPTWVEKTGIIRFTTITASGMSFEMETP